MLTATAVGVKTCRVMTAFRLVTCYLVKKVIEYLHIRLSKVSTRWLCLILHIPHQLQGDPPIYRVACICTRFAPFGCFALSFHLCCAGRKRTCYHWDMNPICNLYTSARYHPAQRSLNSCRVLLNHIQQINEQKPFCVPSLLTSRNCVTFRANIM